jgi:CMP-N,N'-diacetyllegionaminic acid synthase
MNVVAVILARGGSKRLPGKNIRQLAGKPLIAYTIEAAKGAKRVSRTIVSTDAPEIAAVAADYGAEVPFRRPLELAQDDTPSIEALVHAVERVESQGSEIGAVVLLQPTSPMRHSRHIDEAVELYCSTGVDTVTAISPAASHPYWCWRAAGAEITPFFSRAHISMSRHDLPPAFIENGAVYVVRRTLLAAGSLYGERIAGYVMAGEDAIDIDTFEDFERAESILAKRGVVGARAS